MDMAIRMHVHKYTGHFLERNAKRYVRKKIIVKIIPTMISGVDDD